jgi:hypothetical protein
MSLEDQAGYKALDHPEKMADGGFGILGFQGERQATNRNGYREVQQKPSVMVCRYVSSKTFQQLELTG